MSKEKRVAHPLAVVRTTLGWSQTQLAERAGVPRTSVSAVESGRLTPSVNSAIALARAVGRSVETLFASEENDAAWAIDPGAGKVRFFIARVGERLLGFPAAALGFRSIPHDGVWTAGAALVGSADASIRSDDTLVIACCDPASGLLTDELARTAGVRLLVLERGGVAALDLLRRGMVHAAGLHFSTRGDPVRNLEIARRELGGGFHLVRVASWEEGLAMPSDSSARLDSFKGMRRPWALREAGSAARDCFDAVYEGEKSPVGRLVPGHAAVAASVRDGWAGGGVCVRFCAEEAGLAFRSVREEFLDFCIPDAFLADRRIRAMLEVLRSRRHRRLLSELPGYDTRETGELLPA